MGKSQETYSKKEKEKKRLKKRQDKEDKRIDRKSNNNKGRSLDDMIGYVDEYGRLTDTPPDPSKKLVVNLEDIQLGATVNRPVDPADLIRKGIVTFFNDAKGYGFIRDLKSQESLFVHANGLMQPITLNDKVIFEVEMGQKGPMAVRVKIGS
jgi:cold shock CspA family protein